MAEASEVLRANIYKKEQSPISVSPPITPSGTKPDQTALLLASLRDQIALLRQRVAHLEGRLQSGHGPERETASWWATLREEIDAP